jgi:hypothetical protein
MSRPAAPEYASVKARVSQEPTGLHHPRWWQWPTILSLDAPAVSVAWLALLARSLDVDLGPAPLLVLGGSVWLAYAADRWIEGWRLRHEDVRTPRHRFYQRWRRPVAVVWVVVLVCDITVAVTRLTRTELLAGWVLTAAVATYLLSHQFLHRTRRWRLPKEICVAGLLTGGSAVFLVGAAQASAIVPPLTLFAGICFVNCALISSWERDVDLAHQQSSLALNPRHTRWIRRAPWMLAAAALALAFGANASIRVIAGCTMVSALLLAAIDYFEPRIGWPPARVLADVVLMTPLLPLVFAA